MGLKLRITCHTFRATGITAYMDAGSTLENAQLMAAHESPRTTKLYDRTGDEITLDEVERIRIWGILVLPRRSRDDGLTGVTRRKRHVIGEAVAGFHQELEKFLLVRNYALLHKHL
jgi:hypothetical protein